MSRTHRFAFAMSAILLSGCVSPAEADTPTMPPAPPAAPAVPVTIPLRSPMQGWSVDASLDSAAARLELARIEDEIEAELVAARLAEIEAEKCVERMSEAAVSEQWEAALEDYDEAAELLSLCPSSRLAENAPDEKHNAGEACGALWTAAAIGAAIEDNELEPAAAMLKWNVEHAGEGGGE